MTTVTDLNQQSRQEIVQGYAARFVHSPNVTIAYWEVEAGAELPEHFHPHEQLTNVMEGQFRLQIDGESFLLEPGYVVEIPPDVPHAGMALTPCRLIDVFYPVREDYR
jgi:quercetin dioxygenase-like cupin family protein